VGGTNGCFGAFERGLIVGGEVGAFDQTAQAIGRRLEFLAHRPEERVRFLREEVQFRRTHGFTHRFSSGQGGTSGRFRGIVRIAGGYRRARGLNGGVERSEAMLIGRVARADRLRAAAGRWLVTDAIVVGLAGAAVVVDPGTVAGWLGREDPLEIRFAGVGLIVYALLLAGHILKRGASKWSLGFIALLNLLWVVVSIGILLDRFPGLTGAQWEPVVAQGVVVALFALVELRLLRRWRSSRATVR
jgi:hypothetical protein